jgi:hypothetical protein
LGKPFKRDEKLFLVENISKKSLLEINRETFFNSLSDFLRRKTFESQKVNIEEHNKDCLTLRKSFLEISSTMIIN